MSNKTLKEKVDFLHSVYGLYRVKGLDLCVVSWGEYPKFVFHSLNKKNGWKIHTELYNPQTNKYKSLLYIQCGDYWYLVDFDQQYVIGILRDYCLEFNKITRLMEDYLISNV